MKVRLPRPRIEPLPVSEWAEEIRKPVIERGMQDAVLNINRTVAHHPKLLKRWLVFANHILFKQSLPPRHRELLILRIGWLCRCAYEWTAHQSIARDAGLTPEEIARVEQGPGASGWDPFEVLLLRAVDELHADAMISDEVWEGLSRKYTTRQLLDLVFTVGQYNLVSMALNSLGVQPDPGLGGEP